MGKQNKIRKVGRRHNPLDDDIGDHKQVLRKGGKGTKRDNDDDDDGVDTDRGMGVMPPKMTSKLLAMARQERLAADDEARRGAPVNVDALNDDDDYEDCEGDEEEDEELEFDDHTSAATDISDQDPHVPDMDPAEAAALAQFQPASSMQCRTLADIILAKINEAKERKEGRGMDVDGEEEEEENPMDKRIVRVYKTVGKLLKTYTTGRLPKAFKVLPRLANWEDLLWLTGPQNWSPHALYAATRLFASGLNEKMAQRYYYAFLLPSVASAMETPRSEAKMLLHPMRYAAVKKAMFKPAAFMKGFLIPMCEEDATTVQQALIIATILHKCTIPAIPAAVALVKICGMPFTSSNAIIIRSLIDKRLALPTQAIDAVVRYFHNFVKDDRDLPVLWHQVLLTFLLKYGHEMLREQIPMIRDVCHKHYHVGVTPDIHKELCRLEKK